MNKKRENKKPQLPFADDRTAYWSLAARKNAMSKVFFAEIVNWAGPLSFPNAAELSVPHTLIVARARSSASARAHNNASSPSLAPRFSLCIPS